MFSIEITRILSTDMALGHIAIGDFRESFRASLSYWSSEDYQQSWVRSFHELETGATAVSCLVTSITDPLSSNFISTWPLYRTDEVVLIQNSLVFLDELESDFDPRAPWKSVLPHGEYDEDGNGISEWTVPFASMKSFFASLAD